MPKPIKKKISKHDMGAEETVRSFMSVATEKVETNFKQVVIGAVVVLALLIAVAGYIYARSGAEEKAQRAFYDGYKAYHGLYDAKGLTDFERFESALESFRRSYDVKSSPDALLYMAYSQDRLGRYDEAIENLKKLQSDFPDEDYHVALATYKMATIQLKAGRTDDAMSTLDKLYTSGSGIYEDIALAESARLLEAQGKEGEAMEKYRTILSQFPESPFAVEARMKVGDDESEAEAEGEGQGIEAEGAGE
jgi:tetratricopeptide (TPR) repeat protein